MVTLNSKLQILVSELQLDFANNAFGLRVLYKNTFPADFKKFRYYHSDDKLLLYKLWDACFDQKRVERTQILWIDLQTGVQCMRFVQSCNFDLSARFWNQVFIHTLNPNGFDVFPIDV